MQCRAIARRGAGSCTILGDRPPAPGDWETLLAHLARPDARERRAGPRIPGAAQVIACAARLRPRIAPTLRPPVFARRSMGALQVTATTASQLVASTVAACEKALVREGSVGLVAAGTDAVLHSAVLGGTRTRWGRSGLSASPRRW